VSANASDNVAVAKVQFQLDGANLGAPVTVSPYQISWDTTAVKNGLRTLDAVATDTSGNTANTSVTVKIVNGGVFGSVINTPANPVTGDPVVPMNMVLLDNGKILFWDGGPSCLGAVSPTVWDPVTNTFTAVPLENQTEVRDIFCSDQTVLSNGDVLVAGGHDCTSPTYIGTAIANVFDPATNTWAFLPNMNDRRWYPNALTLPDGRALVTAGSARSTLDYDPIPEVYDPVSNTWTKLTGANQVIPNYPFMFVLPNGNVMAAGSDEAKMGSYELNVATQTWSVVDPTVLDAGSAVQYLPGKIMKTGSSYLSAPADNRRRHPVRRHLLRHRHEPAEPRLAADGLDGQPAHPPQPDHPARRHGAGDRRLDRHRRPDPRANPDPVARWYVRAACPAQRDGRHERAVPGGPAAAAGASGLEPRPVLQRAGPLQGQERWGGPHVGGRGLTHQPPGEWANRTAGKGA
jgi:hypothetical protein